MNFLSEILFKTEKSSASVVFPRVWINEIRSADKICSQSRLKKRLTCFLFSSFRLFSVFSILFRVLSCTHLAFYAHTFIIVLVKFPIELSSLSDIEDGTEKECLNESIEGKGGREMCCETAGFGFIFGRIFWRMEAGGGWNLPSLLHHDLIYEKLQGATVFFAVFSALALNANNEQQRKK